MTTHPAADLPVPESSRDALWDYAADFYERDRPDEAAAIHAVAAPIAAAELRRLADNLAAIAPGSELLVNRGRAQAAALLRARADQLG